MKTFPLLVLLTLAGLTACFAPACKTSVAVAPGGAYSDVNLALTDKAILDANSALEGFLSWYNSNAAVLAKWPEVGKLAATVTAQKNGWIRDAYAARDAYALAAIAYRKALADGAANAVPPERAKMDGALSILKTAIDQFNAYKAAHP